MTDLVKILYRASSKGGSIVLWSNAPNAESIEQAIEKIKDFAGPVSPYRWERIEVDSFQELERLARQYSHALNGLTPDPTYFTGTNSVTVWELVAKGPSDYGLVLDGGASMALGFD